ncbi:MAG: xylose operon transcription regulator XylR, partial [Blastopirellula sp. JB062]
MQQDRYRRVAVLIETDDTWGRSVVEAIGHYARQQHWRLLIGPRDSQNRLRLPKRWNGDGV